MRCRLLLSPVCLACAALLLLAPTARADTPSWLPRYDVGVLIDVDGHEVRVRQRVQWTNPHKTPTNKIVFNAHSHYSIPDKDVALLAKMLEILRLAPKDGLDFNGPPLTVQTVRLTSGPGPPEAAPNLPLATSATTTPPSKSPCRPWLAPANR